jgi:predicted phage terminase large subunit-like protein
MKTRLVKVRCVRAAPAVRATYNLSVAGEHDYYANGIRTHNCVDDAHNVMEGESETVREGTCEWFFTSFMTRMNDQRTGSVVIIMQRVHERDLTGQALAKDLGFEHLCLPARYEGEDRINTSLVTWGDWRTEQREPLWPERLPEKELADMEKALGPYAAAGQLQQRPAPREGGMYDVKKLAIIKSIDRRTIKRTVRYWDKAATQGGGCETAGVLMSELNDGRILIEDVVHGQWATDGREAKMKDTAVADTHTHPPRGPLIVMEQEPGSGGKDSAVWSARNLRGFRVRVDKVTGSKEDRAEPFSGQVNVGNVLLLEAEWNDTLKTQLEMFPNGASKDIADASSGAFNHLCVRGKKKVGVFGSGKGNGYTPTVAVPGLPVASVKKVVRMRFIGV